MQRLTQRHMAQPPQPALAPPLCAAQVRVDAYAGEALRYILAFDCPGTVVLRGVHWARLVVVGQSFMLHQIRKMVGRGLQEGVGQ